MIYEKEKVTAKLQMQQRKSRENFVSRDFPFWGFCRAGYRRGDRGVTVLANVGNWLQYQLSLNILNIILECAKLTTVLGKL